MHLFPHLHSFFGYIGYLKNLSYPELFLVIIASGHLLPIPEPITLIILGYLSGVGRSNFFGLVLVAALAVICFDTVVYLVAKSGSKLAGYLTRKVNLHLFDKYTKASNFDLAILFTVSHFVPGWRMANPVIAGAADIDFKKFFLLTLVSAILYAPVYLLIGYFFRSKILYLITTFEAVHNLILPVIVVLMVLALIVYLFLKTKKEDIIVG